MVACSLYECSECLFAKSCPDNQKIEAEIERIIHEAPELLAEFLREEAEDPPCQILILMGALAGWLVASAEKTDGFDLAESIMTTLYYFYEIGDGRAKTPPIEVPLNLQAVREAE